MAYTINSMPSLRLVSLLITANYKPVCKNKENMNSILFHPINKLKTIDLHVING